MSKTTFTTEAEMEQWQVQAIAAFKQGQSQVEFIAHTHPSNRSKARKAYRIVERVLRDS